MERKKLANIRPFSVNAALSSKQTPGKTLEFEKNVKKTAETAVVIHKLDPHFQYTCIMRYTYM